MKDHLKNRLSLDQLLEGIDQQSRIILGKAISIVESRLFEDKALSVRLLDQIEPKTGRSIRIGITGVPGVGKSTFIDAFGSYLTKHGKKVAVLTIDPSSAISRGSILGDKTRMSGLATDPNAFIRPSPSGTSLGGVAQKTRETISVCEAAGYNVIIVETVGVGQSEVAVKDMVDFFLLLMLAGGGDELQGIKRGIMEMADAIVINKADGDNLKPAKQAQKTYANALHLFPPHESGWTVPVETCSAVEATGLEKIWKLIVSYQQQMQSYGYFNKQRDRQKVKWMDSLIKNRLEEDFFASPTTKEKLRKLTQKVTAGELSVRHAVDQLFS